MHEKSWEVVVITCLKKGWKMRPETTWWPWSSGLNAGSQPPGHFCASWFNSAWVQWVLFFLLLWRWVLLLGTDGGRESERRRSVGHTNTIPGQWPQHIGRGGRGLVQATQSSSCSHRNRRWAEWVAWLCGPFLFLFKSLLAMHCLLVIFVLIKIKTVAKKTLPTSKQLALQADDIYSGVGGGLEIWLDLPGSEIGYLFFKPCTDRPPRAVPGWDWQTNLNTNAAPGRGDFQIQGREGPQDSIVVSWEREGLLPQLWASSLLSLPGPFSAGLLASLLSILQGLMPQCKGKMGNLKEKKKTLKAWDVSCILIPQLDFIRVLQKSKVWGLCCPIVRV